MSDPINDIQKQYRVVVYTALATAACMLFGLFSLLYAIPVGVTLIVLAVVFYFALFRPNRRRYTNLVTGTNLERTICRLIGSAVPQPVGGDIFSGRTVMDSDLLPEGKDGTEPLFCWEMTGRSKIIAVSLADTTMLQKFTGQNGRYIYHTSSGVFSVFDLPRDPHRYFLFTDRELLPDPVRELFMNTKPQYIKESLNDEDLDDRFIFYRSTKDTGKEIPPTFMQSLKRLMNYTPGQIAISVKGRKMYAFINGRFVSRRVTLSRTITVEDLDTNEFPEITYLLNIAATLGVGDGRKDPQTETIPEDEPEEEEKK